MSKRRRRNSSGSSYSGSDTARKSNDLDSRGDPGSPSRYRSPSRSVSPQPARRSSRRSESPSRGSDSDRNSVHSEESDSVRTPAVRGEASIPKLCGRDNPVLAMESLSPLERIMPKGSSLRSKPVVSVSELAVGRWELARGVRLDKDAESYEIPVHRDQLTNFQAPAIEPSHLKLFSRRREGDEDRLRRWETEVSAAAAILSIYYGVVADKTARIREKQDDGEEPDEMDCTVELDSVKLLEALDQAMSLLGSAVSRMEHSRAHNALGALSSDNRPSSLGAALEKRSNRYLLGKRSADWAKQERRRRRRLDEQAQEQVSVTSKVPKSTVSAEFYHRLLHGSVRTKLSRRTFGSKHKFNVAKSRYAKLVTGNKYDVTNFRHENSNNTNDNVIESVKEVDPRCREVVSTEPVVQIVAEAASKASVEGHPVLGPVLANNQIDTTVHSAEPSSNSEQSSVWKTRLVTDSCDSRIGTVDKSTQPSHQAMLDQSTTSGQCASRSSRGPTNKGPRCVENWDLPGFRQKMSDIGVSEGVSQFLQRARRSSTRKRYGDVWSHWEQWAEQHKVTPSTPELSQDPRVPKKAIAVIAVRWIINYRCG